MPKVRVDDIAIVIDHPGLHIVYQPGERDAPEAHIVDILRQGKGERLSDAAAPEDAPPAPAP